MTNKRILIVESEPDNRQKLKEALETGGLEADAISQPEETLQKLIEHSYDAIILDWGLPARDGLTVLRQVAQQCVGTKVIIITAPDTTETAVDAMKLGAVDFFQKPFKPAAVREIVGRVLALPAAGTATFSYEEYLVMAQKSMASKDFRTAFVYAHKAVFLNSKRPEAFDLLRGLYRNRIRAKDSGL